MYTNVLRRLIMAELFLDCIGEACPVPLIKAQQELATMQTGDRLTINVDTAFRDRGFVLLPPCETPS